MRSPPDPFDLPPDPFNKEDDPSLFLDPVDPPMNLSTEDLVEIQTELRELNLFKKVLGSQGIRGLVNYCEDCGELHYYDWNILLSHYQQLLVERQSQPHEPAFNVDPSLYVSWDYCRGYCDREVFGKPNPFRTEYRHENS